MYKSNCYEHRVVGDRNSLIKDQIKHTTFCAKFRNARCSNLSPSNRFVDLKPKKKNQQKNIARISSGISKFPANSRISERIRFLTHFPAERLGRCMPTRFQRRRRREQGLGGARRREPPWNHRDPPVRFGSVMYLFIYLLVEPETGRNGSYET